MRQLIAVTVGWTLLVGSQDAAKPIVLVGARILDVAAARYSPAAAVVVIGGRISAIHRQMPETPPAGDQIDLKGATLVPGLADMHARGTPGPDADVEFFYTLALAHGVTMIRTLDVALPWAVAQRERTSRGDIVGPRVWTSGPGLDHVTSAGPRLTGLRSPFRLVTLIDAAQADRESRAQIAARVDWISVHGQVGVDLYRAIASSTRGTSVKVAGEALTASMGQLAELGVSSLEGIGAMRPATEFPSAGASARAEPRAANQRPESNLQEIIIRQWESASAADVRTAAIALAKTQVVIVPMLHAAATLADPSSASADAGLEHLSATARKAITEAKSAPPRNLRRVRDAQLAFVRDFVRAGGKVVTATGTGENSYPVAGVGVHSEIGALVAAGLSPADALRAATVNAADLAGASSTLGQIKVAFSADLFAVQGDPLKSVGDLSKIVFIMRGGEVLDRKQLLEQARRVRR